MSDILNNLGNSRGAKVPPPTALSPAKEHHHESFSAMGRAISLSIAVERRVDEIYERLYGVSSATPQNPAVPPAGLLDSLAQMMISLEERLEHCNQALSRIRNDLPSAN